MAKGKVLEAVVSLAGEINPSLGKAIDNATGKVSKLNLKAVAIGAAVGGVAVATGKAVTKAAGYLKDLGSAFDKATDAIRIGTGATGEALDGLLEDFDEVYKSVPASMEDASKAIADYNTRLGLTGPTLQNISKQALQVSSMLDEDLGGVIQSSSEAFQQWNISAENMGDAMDYVFKVSQSTGKGFSDIMQTVQKFGPELQSLGYSFEDATALLGQLDKAGVETSEVLASMKKATVNFAKEGISAADGIKIYYDEIQKATSATEAATIASEIFGSKAGPKMADLIRSGAMSVSDLTAELVANGETIAGAAEDTYSFTERLQIMKQGLEVALKPMANTVFNGLNKFMPTLQKLMEKIAPTITKAVNAAAPFVEDFLLGAADALEGVLPLIEQLASDLFPLLTQLLSQLLPPLLSLIQALLPPLMQIIEAILPPAIELIMAVLPMITQIAEIILPVIADLLTTLLPVLTPILELLLGIVNDVVMPLMEPIGLLVESLMPLITPILEMITASLEPIGPILKVIGDVLGVIIGAISTVVGWISKGLGWIVKLIFGSGGDTEAADKVNGYATGGFTDGLSIAGEDPHYPTEAIISFNPKYKAENIQYWTKAGQMLGVSELTYSGYSGRQIETSASSGESGGVGDVYNNSSTTVYDVGGISFSPNITISGDADENDIISQIKELEPEFVDFVLNALARREAGDYGDADGQVY